MAEEDQLNSSPEGGWSWTTLIALYLLLNVGPVWLFVYKFGGRKPIVGPKDKFRPFNRTDTQEWSYVWSLFTHLLVWPRVILSYVIVVNLGMLLSWVFSIGYDRRTKPSQWRRAIWNFILTSSARASIFVYGCFWITTKRVNYDYSKYLGPDHKHSFEGAPTVVLNHQSFGDILVLLSKCHPHPGFIAKWEIQKIPGLGFYADTVLRSLFVKREDSKSKHGVLE